MKHYVGFHNPKKMGRSAFSEGFNSFSVRTRKNLGDLEGSKVWMITKHGEEEPVYYLYSWFIIDVVKPLNGDEFEFAIRGKEGHEFDPPINLDEEEWFPDFKKNMVNFSRGFSEIKDYKMIGQFMRIAKEVATEAVAVQE